MSRPSTAAPAIPPATRDLLLPLAILGIVGVYVRALLFTPSEALQGDAQKIFYVHAPSAFVGLYFACALLFLCSIAWLFLKDDRLDRLAESCAEIALAFLTIVLVTGPIWGKPVWGAWWTWDARLTLTLFLWFMVLGYMILRGAIEEPGMRARYAAVLGVMSGVLVPFIHLSVYLFRTLHPMPIVLKPDKPSLSPEMGLTFGLSMAAFTLLFVALLRARYRYAIRRDLLAARLAGGDA